MSREISDLGMEPDGTLYITFMDTRDIRCEGAVALRQTLRVAPSPDYIEGIQRVVDAAALLLADALSDHAKSEPVDLPGELPTQERGTDVPSEPTEDEAARRNWAKIEESRGSAT